MTNKVRHFLNRVDATTKKISKPFSFLAFILMLLTVTEVVARYVFNNPTIFVWPLNKQIFGIFILVAGAYTASKQGHIRIDIFYDHFPAILKLISRLLTLAAMVAFLGVLIWQSAWMGWNSLMERQIVSGAFRIPYYPFKLFVSIGTFLFLVQGISIYSRRDDL